MWSGIYIENGMKTVQIYTEDPGRIMCVDFWLYVSRCPQPIKKRWVIKLINLAIIAIHVTSGLFGNARSFFIFTEYWTSISDCVYIRSRVCRPTLQIAKRVLVPLVYYTFYTMDAVLRNINNIPVDMVVCILKKVLAGGSFEDFFSWFHGMVPESTALCDYSASACISHSGAV